VKEKPPSGGADNKHGPPQAVANDPINSWPWVDLPDEKDLSWVPLFQNIDPALLHSALATSDVLLLPAGFTLLHPGDINRNIYIVLSGEVAAFLDGDGYQSAGISIPIGQCVGEFSAIDGKPVSALVKTVTESRVLRLTGDVMWSGLILLPGVAKNLMTCLTERMRLTNRVTLEAQREGLELSQLRKELQLANELQAGMLPLQRPLFPDRHDIEVSALMEPASKVGGDLFDVFFVDHNRLFLCIGDVSGHGIVAALFMARAIGLLRILAFSVQTPDELLSKLNERLCEGNETSIFLTLFCGFLDVPTGLLQYSNGGHLAPLVVTETESSLLPLPTGPLIGAFPGMTFSSKTFILEIGDLLLGYTDGITEAENALGEQFSEQRCLNFLSKRRPDSLRQSVDGLRQQVQTFTGVDTLEDDGALLAIRRTML
jgi:phosphoserine phosphatase RsbU/P